MPIVPRVTRQADYMLPLPKIGIRIHPRDTSYLIFTCKIPVNSLYNLLSYRDLSPGAPRASSTRACSSTTTGCLRNVGRSRRVWSARGQIFSTTSTRRPVFRCPTPPLETPQRSPPQGPPGGCSAAGRGCSAAGRGHTAPESGSKGSWSAHAAGRGLLRASSSQGVLPLPKVGTAFAIEAARTALSQAVS